MLKMFSVILFSFSQSAYSAGYVVNDGIITEVANVADNIGQFALRVLSAKARGKILRYVIDGDHVDCIISGLAEQE